jgi:hypothetical protein
MARHWQTMAAVLALASAGFTAQSEDTRASFTVCQGMCDASAVVMVGPEHFLVADDEDNILRLYSRTQDGAPVESMDLSQFLHVDLQSPEVDLEGAAPLGDRVYWISSHARNKNGKDRPSRRRFFATTLTRTNNATVMQPVGLAYELLLEDLLREPQLQPFRLAAAAQRAPKSKNALNIEGLCATPDGHLWIGFRNPVPRGKALVVPLLNPADLIAGRPARFGDPLLVDLGGLGIRSLARAGDRYLIIAGSYDGSGPSHLFEWKGGSERPRRLPHAQLTGLNPEAVESFTLNGAEHLLVVSDDGALRIGGEECKSVKDPNLKYFRATTLKL